MKKLTMQDILDATKSFTPLVTEILLTTKDRNRLGATMLLSQTVVEDPIIFGSITVRIMDWLPLGYAGLLYNNGELKIVILDQ